MLRYLRVAVVVLCLIASVLLFALWVRSYWQIDQLIRRISTVDYVAFTSIQGTLVFGKSNNDPVLQQVFTQKWRWKGLAMKDWDDPVARSVPYFPCTKPRDNELVRVPRFRSHPFVVAPGTTYYELICPYWLLVLMTASFAALLIKPRFKLRTLLVAMSLLAVLFGLAAISK